MLEACDKLALRILPKHAKGPQGTSPRTEHARASVGGDASVDPTLTAWGPSKFQWPHQTGGGQQWEQTGDPRPCTDPGACGEGWVLTAGPPKPPRPTEHSKGRQAQPPALPGVRCAQCRRVVRPHSRCACRSGAAVKGPPHPSQQNPCERLLHGPASPHPSAEHLFTHAHPGDPGRIEVLTPQQKRVRSAIHNLLTKHHCQDEASERGALLLQLSGDVQQHGLPPFGRQPQISPWRWARLHPGADCGFWKEFVQDTNFVHSGKSTASATPLCQQPVSMACSPFSARGGGVGGWGTLPRSPACPGAQPALGAHPVRSPACPGAQPAQEPAIGHSATSSL